jgi:hypothetical protein
MFLLRLEAIAAVDEPLIAPAGMGARMLALKPDGQPAAPIAGPRTGNTFAMMPLRRSRRSVACARGRSLISPRCRPTNGIAAASILAAAA